MVRGCDNVAVQSLKVDPAWLKRCRTAPFLALSGVFDKYKVVSPTLHFALIPEVESRGAVFDEG